MKNPVLFMLLLASIMACKKSNNTTPEPQATPPSNTNNPTNNNPNDTVGKVKIFYSLQMNPVTVGYGLGCTGRDYVQDTNNVHIYHNNKQLHNHFVSMRTVPDGVGLNVLENGLISALAHTVTPLWANIGDSIVVVFDSLEINGTSAAQSERFQRTILKITKNGSIQYNFDTYQYGNWASILNPYYTTTGNSNRFLGTTKINTITQNWFIGGQFRLVYHIQ